MGVGINNWVTGLELPVLPGPVITGRPHSTSPVPMARPPRVVLKPGLVLQHRLTPKTLLVFHHVYGHAGGVLLNNLKHSNVTQDAEWVSVIAHLYYDLTDNVSIGARAEWYRDQDGFRNPSPFRIAAATNRVNGTAVSYAGSLSDVTITPADYYDVTVGLNWKAAKSLKLKEKFLQKLSIRPNIRYDRVDAYRSAAYRPFADHKDQILFSLDFLLPF